jgi:hypothetical protein
LPENSNTVTEVARHIGGDDKKAVALARAAADLDATMDKHPATPSSVLPARELLADLLLELNQPPVKALPRARPAIPGRRRPTLSVCFAARASPRRLRKRLGSVAGLQLFGDAAAQQMFPTRTVRFILPFGAGSASDATARLFADRLSARWGKLDQPNLY